jgi:hypothetical protein
MAINFVGTDIKRGDPRTFDPEYDPQIRFDYRSVNRVFSSGGQLMNLMRFQRWMKWIAFECLSRSANRVLLFVPELVEVPPEFLDGAILITHAPGGVSFSAVSIATKR